MTAAQRYVEEHPEAAITAIRMADLKNRDHLPVWTTFILDGTQSELYIPSLTEITSECRWYGASIWFNVETVKKMNNQMQTLSPQEQEYIIACCDGLICTNKSDKEMETVIDQFTFGKWDKKALRKITSDHPLVCVRSYR